MHHVIRKSQVVVLQVVQAIQVLPILLQLVVHLIVLPVAVLVVLHIIVPQVIIQLLPHTIAQVALIKVAHLINPEDIILQRNQIQKVDAIRRRVKLIVIKEVVHQVQAQQVLIVITKNQEDVIKRRVKPIVIKEVVHQVQANRY